jgi:DNA polymerase delta, subunit 4
MVSVYVLETPDPEQRRTPRLDRWHRAAKLGLDPPKAVLDILRVAGEDSARNKCIWDGRV